MVEGGVGRNPPPSRRVFAPIHLPLRGDWALSPAYFSTISSHFLPSKRV